MKVCYCQCNTTTYIFLICIPRQATLIAPLVTFGYVDQWVRVVLGKAVSHQHNTDGNIHDPVYLEWEALSIVSIQSCLVYEM